jgi:uncharacterized protein (TIGR03083 family)
MSDIGAVYAEGRERISGIVTALGEEQQRGSVPACPEWTVHDVVAHLAGICEDVLTGNLEGVTTDPWTAEQVAKRREWPTDELVAEWGQLAPQVEGMAAAFPAEVGKQWVADLTTHEHDIRAAVGQPGARDSRGVETAVEFAVAVALDASLKGNGLPALRVVAGNRDFTVGGEQATATMAGSKFDVMRAVMGRRSRNQILSFDWNGGDPEVYLGAFEFGPFTLPARDLDE